MLQTVQKNNKITLPPASPSALQQLLQKTVVRTQAPADSKVSTAGKEPTSPKKGGFEMVLKGGPRKLLPISVDWEAYGPVINGVQKIRGFVKYVVQGEVVSFALDQNNSFIQNNKIKISFASPVLKGSYVYEKNIASQERKLLDIREIIQEMLKYKKSGKQPPQLNGSLKSINVLAAQLYSALLSFGVADIKYGRSAYANKIRTWLGIALDPKQVGWTMSGAVAGALGQLGMKAQRGKKVKGQLRPVEVFVKGRKLQPTLNLLVIDRAELRNLLDTLINQYANDANAAIRQMRRWGQTPTGLGIMMQLNREGRDLRHYAQQIALLLAQAGVLNVEGVQVEPVRTAIEQFWMAYMAADDDRAQRGRAVLNLRIALQAQYGPLNNDVFALVEQALARAPFARFNGQARLTNQIVRAEQLNRGARPNTMSSSFSLFNDRSRPD